MVYRSWPSISIARCINASGFFYVVPPSSPPGVSVWADVTLGCLAVARDCQRGHLYTADKNKRGRRSCPVRLTGSLAGAPSRAHASGKPEFYLLRQHQADSVTRTRYHAPPLHTGTPGATSYARGVDTLTHVGELTAQRALTPVHIFRSGGGLEADWLRRAVGGSSDRKKGKFPLLTPFFSM